MIYMSKVEWFATTAKEQGRYSVKLTGKSGHFTDAAFTSLHFERNVSP